MDRKELLIKACEKHRDLIYEAEDYIWKHPEPGYREWNTCAYLARKFEDLGYTLTMAGNIPGFYTDIDTGRPGPKFAILGELDSLIVENHPDADPETHAVHACGHNCQCAILLGVAAALKEPGVLDGMCGSIRLISVPAEELIELGFRNELREQGIIKYFGGKVEFIYRGYFDGVDMAMMIHGGNLPEGKTLQISPGCNGCITKNITYTGVSAHAGGAPEQGRNALYAATVALDACNALRETFIDDGHVRFHPIITEAGLAVNAIPEKAKLESFVRGTSVDVMSRYNKEVNRALASAAAALGCSVLLEDHPGYFPLNNDKNLCGIVKDVMESISGPGTVVVDNEWGGGSTDMGDVSSIMPAIHPHCSGSIGKGHGADYFVNDLNLACMLPVECLIETADRLLGDDALLAKKVIAESKPYFSSKEEYLKAIDELDMVREAVIYNEDGTITLNYTK